MTDTPLLSVRGLRAGYGGIPVVFHLDLDVGAGEIVTLLGANGAGKTTTLRAVSGMIPPMAGTVSLAGERLDGRPAQRIARLGVVHIPEGRGVFPSLEVDETLRLAATMAGVPRRDLAATVDEMYATFPPLARRRGQAARHLSGGEQQMLALARGLIHRPRVLMIDEMSQGLAPTVVDALFALVETLPARGVSLLLVEQFVSRALQLASRAYVLEKGEVSYAGSAAALAADEAFVRGSYLGDAGEPAAVMR
jgi:branched-chain amino acid transport system ATP-binding protein